MSIKKKSIQKKDFSLIGNSEIFQAKQKIAIEKYGEVFEDEVFFALEISLNKELDRDLNMEYKKRCLVNKKMN